MIFCLKASKMMSLGSMLLCAMAIACIFTCGERICKGLNTNSFIMSMILFVTFILSLIQFEIVLLGNKIFVVGVVFSLSIGIWAVMRSIMQGERITKLILSTMLCAMLILLALLVWPDASYNNIALLGIVVGLVCAIVADTVTGAITYSLIGTLLASTAFEILAKIYGGMAIWVIGGDISFDIAIVTLLNALVLFEIKRKVKTLVKKRTEAARS